MTERTTLDSVSNRFFMVGGPWGGQMLRIFRPDYDGFTVEGGRYVRPPEVDPEMRSGRPNKARTNVPRMTWEEAK